LKGNLLLRRCFESRPFRDGERAEKLRYLVRGAEDYIRTGVFWPHTKTTHLDAHYGGCRDALRAEIEEASAQVEAELHRERMEEARALISAFELKHGLKSSLIIV
jgi:hypothetical protein